MKQPDRIIVLQTAFLGDVILTLPLVQVLHRELPHTHVDFLTTPQGAAILQNHQSIHSVLEYDKRGNQRGIGGMLSTSRRIKAQRYDMALVPHRSLRSSLVAALSRIPIRIAFDTSAGRFLFTDLVHYEKNLHEIERNLSFLKAFDIGLPQKELPSLYPSSEDIISVDRFLTDHRIEKEERLIAVAPGSVWNTKRWPSDRFADLVRKISDAGMKTILVGGKADESLCRRIGAGMESAGVYCSAGKFTILQSAEMIRRCKALVSNDSAPMHLAVAMRTPVIALFGATVPSFGFGPYGEKDVVVQVDGLSCRPCSIHGGDRCPIGTFECMVNISAKMVFEKVVQLEGSVSLVSTSKT
ncbi:MAG: lipopolysaccharide heptosyltransferase II [Bacteroidota bacterium]